MLVLVMTCFAVFFWSAVVATDVDNVVVVTDGVCSVGYVADVVGVGGVRVCNVYV